MGLKRCLLSSVCVVLLACTVRAVHNSSPLQRITFGEGVGSDSVEVAFYGEALCPGCQRVWTDVLPDVVEKVGDIINFRWVPYGNAHRINGTVICQHGPVECEVDTLEGCAVHLHPFTKPLSSDATWQFLHCVESQGSQLANSSRQVVASCAGEHGLDVVKLDECAHGPLGRKLQRKAGWATASLDPPHTFVPWVTVNGKPLGEHPEGLLAAVCGAYMGQHAPEACGSQAPSEVAGERSGDAFDVCPVWV